MDPTQNTLSMASLRQYARQEIAPIIDRLLEEFLLLESTCFYFTYHFPELRHETCVSPSTEELFEFADISGLYTNSREAIDAIIYHCDRSTNRFYQVDNIKLNLHGITKYLCGYRLIERGCERYDLYGNDDKLTKTIRAYNGFAIQAVNLVRRLMHYFNCLISPIHQFIGAGLTQIQWGFLNAIVSDHRQNPSRPYNPQNPLSSGGERIHTGIVTPRYLD